MRTLLIIAVSFGALVYGAEAIVRIVQWRARNKELTKLDLKK